MQDIILFSLIICLFFIFIVIELIRKRKLKEQYSLWWIFFALTMIILSTNSKWLNFIADRLDIKYPPAFLFLIGIIICLVLILHLTVVISNLSERVIKLTQEIGILKQETFNQSKES